MAQLAPFATIADIEELWRNLSAEEEERATALLPVVSNSLRVEAKKWGADLDALAEEEAYSSVLTSVTVDIVVRALKQSTDTTGDPLSQESQSALGYSWSGTYAIPGGGLPIMRNDLKRLGLRRQKMGVIEFYDNKGNHDNPTQ